MFKSEGIVNRRSKYTVERTVEILRNALQEKAIPLFALVDHSGEAEKAGMKMSPTKLLIFGNPKAGTPAMLEAPSLALDLPLKILVWQDPKAAIWLSYNSLDYLQERHGVPRELMKNFAALEALAAAVCE